MDTQENPGLSRRLIFLMACAVAASAANLYYNQPLLPVIGRDLGLSHDSIGWIPGLNQVGYALSILLISPLGDVVARRRLIDFLSVFLVLGSLLAVVSQGVLMLGLASLVIGISANITQQLLPFAATLVSAEQKPKVIATLMTGLTLGILLSRTLSGFVGEHFGWRGVFVMSALLALLFGLALHRALPWREPPLRMRYGALLASMWSLFRRHAVLRQSAFTGLFWFAAFNALWATLALHVSEAPLNYNTQQAGMFGVVAAAGVVGAKLSGIWVGRFGARHTITASVLLILAGFGLSGFYGDRLWALVVGILLIDFGVFSAQVANQVRVFSIDPEAQSRVNGVYMLGYYLGASLGSLSGVQAFALAGWPAVCTLAAFFLLASLVANNPTLWRR
ncbi:MFS transporter [Granulosicoccaceae sp. 1_MG-2023]|nr:MFS transporter [Granulosicoccaceae sp. 1_MG-2023]